MVQLELNNCFVLISVCNATNIPTAGVHSEYCSCFQCPSFSCLGYADECTV